MINSLISYCSFPFFHTLNLQILICLEYSKLFSLENLHTFNKEIIYNNSQGQKTIYLNTEKYKFLIIIGKDNNWNYLSPGVIPVLDLNLLPQSFAIGSSISGEANDHIYLELYRDRITVKATRSYYDKIFALIGYF
uniref:Uncharacterized protein n=1 Tax=Caudovirales sp. ctIbU14 TaxID=2825761 RepID=A0A8S5NTJ1_9CAUD|nr:MAG TPA: hypothetical protein [Caudovirales sp. ctIbU14]